MIVSPVSRPNDNCHFLYPSKRKEAPDETTERLPSPVCLFPVPDPLLSGPAPGRHRLPGNADLPFRRPPLSAEIRIYPRLSLLDYFRSPYALAAYLPSPCAIHRLHLQKSPSLCPVPPAHSLPRPRCQPQAPPWGPAAAIAPNPRARYTAVAASMMAPHPRPTPNHRAPPTLIPDLSHVVL